MEEWIKKYIDYLFPVDNRLIKISAANSLKAKHTPNKLFKYRGVSNQYSFDNFNQDCLSLSEASKLNDPFECALSAVSKQFFFSQLRNAFLTTMIGNDGFSANELTKMKSCSESEFYEIIENRSELFSKLPRGTLKRVSDSFIDDFCNATNDKLCEKNLSNIYICALSETNNSPAMWAHYAEEFRGFCIEYDFSKILGKPIWCSLNPVIYTDSIPDFSEYFGKSDCFNNLISIYAAMIKAEDWSYEREWRLIIPLGKQPDSYFLVNAPKPSAIYLGCRISKEDEDKLVQIARNKDIKVFKMVRPSSTFEVKFKEI